MLGKSPESGSGQPRKGGRTQNVPRIMFASRSLVKLQEIACYSPKRSSYRGSAAAQEPEPGSFFGNKPAHADWRAPIALVHSSSYPSPANLR
jgi:hypothetical protein